MTAVYIVLGIIGFFIILYFALVDDAVLTFWYVFDKRKLRYKVIKKFQKDNQTIYIIGTYYGKHFSLEDFSHTYLKAALLNIKPKLLLVESRQKELDKGNIADGSFEMLYLHLVAKDMGIDVKGIDWFELNASHPGTTDKVRAHNIFENIIQAIESVESVLVFTGKSHMVYTAKTLSQIGYKQKRLTKDDIDNIYRNPDTKLTFHEDTIKYLENRIEHEKITLEEEVLNPEWKSRIKIIIQELEKFIAFIEKENNK